MKGDLASSIRTDTVGIGPMGSLNKDCVEGLRGRVTQDITIGLIARSCATNILKYDIGRNSVPSFSDVVTPTDQSCTSYWFL
jgi:hypothetical protein